MSNGSKKWIKVKNKWRDLKLNTSKAMEFVRLTFNIDKKKKRRNEAVKRKMSRQRRFKVLHKRTIFVQGCKGM